MKRIRSKCGVLIVIALLAVVCAAAQQQDRNSAQPNAGYVLGPDDQIAIRTADIPEISDKTILIGINGNITLPMIGRVKASGMTVEQLETELNKRFKEYLEDPQVTVTVTEYRSQPVSVFGAVGNPGVIQLRGRKTLYEVLSMVGGPRETAGASMTVSRRRENGDLPLLGATIDPTGQFSTAELNVQAIIKGKNPAANIEIKPNDVVSVSEANFDMIYVVGDVQHSGAFPLGGQTTISVLRVVSLAGGFGRSAKPDKVKIIRNVPGETKPREIAVDVLKIMAGKAEDIAVGPQDVLVVPSSSRKAFLTSFVPGFATSMAYAAIYKF